MRASQDKFACCGGTCVKGDRADVVVLGLGSELPLQLLVEEDLLLEFGQSRVLLHEFLQLRIAILLPDGAELREMLECALDVLE